MRKRVLFLMIVVIAGSIIMAVFFFTLDHYTGNKYKDLCGYTEKLLKIEWNDCIESAAGDVGTDQGEEYAYIKLEVRAGYEEEVLSIVQNRFGETIDFTSYTIPPWEGHEFVTEIMNSSIQHISEIIMEGKRVKTRDIEVYVVYDETGKMFIYVMG